MSHAIGLRATSLAASTGLLTLAVVAALTMTIVQRQIAAAPLGPRPIETLVASPPEPPPERRPVRPSAPPVQEGFEAPPVPAPVEPMPPTPTTQPVAQRPAEVVDPHWLRRPRDLARYYPRRALERGVEGRVVLNCAVDVRGALACAVASETPANWGFGEAALRISRDYRMVPAVQDGRPVEARYRMVVPFELQ